MTIGERDYRDRSHEWLDRLLRRRSSNDPPETPPPEAGPVVDRLDASAPMQRRAPRNWRLRRWLIPLAVVVNGFAVLWTVISVFGLDYLVAILADGLKSMPRDWWLGSAVVAGVWLAPYVVRALRRWR